MSKVATVSIDYFGEKIELKACPFCGSLNLHVYLNAPGSDIDPWKHVACLECGCGQSTIEKWNRRA